MKIKKISPDHWALSRLKELLKQVEGKRILVIGDVGVDRYAEGLVDRISPEAPVPIVLIQDEKHKLGLAANVADNIRVLKGEPWLVGVVGSDPGAKTLGKLLTQAKVSAQYLVKDPSRRTILKERIVSGRHQMLRVDYESHHALDAQVQKRILETVRKALPKVDGVILQDYAKGLITRELAQSILRLARRARKWVAVDPNSKTPVSFYAGAFILTPNRREAEMLSGIKIRSDADLVRAARVILSKTQAPHVVVTLGKDGMALFSKKSSEVLQIPTYAQDVFDVSGAGDTVISIMTLALASGASLPEAMILGNVAAGVVVGKFGTATVTPQEVIQAMSRVKADAL